MKGAVCCAALLLYKRVLTFFWTKLIGVPALFFFLFGTP
jgi:hypothetical protein